MHLSEVVLVVLGAWLVLSVPIAILCARLLRRRQAEFNRLPADLAEIISERDKATTIADLLPPEDSPFWGDDSPVPLPRPTSRYEYH